MSETEQTTINQTEQGSIIKEQDIPQEEKAFLTDTTAKTVWMKTKTGKEFIKMNYIEMLAKKAYPLFEKLQHKESLELFDFKYTYYDQTDQNGNKVPDSVGSVYRYPKGSGGGSRPQYKKTYMRKVFQGLLDPTNEKLADPNGKWRPINSHYDSEAREVIYTIYWDE